ncbi:MAG: CAP-associated domain-containing protein [Peptostreptococcaceae bacterium]
MKKIILIVIIFITIVFYNSDLKKILSENNNLGSGNKSSESVNYNVQEDSIDINKFEEIRIGDSTSKVISLIGDPSRIDFSEYNFKWYVYNQYEEHFVMVGVENDNVVALYSNSINSSEITEISINDNREDVLRKYEPLEYKQKGNTRYIINSNNQYDIVKVDNKYITFFYDIYEENRICSYQIISNEAESSLRQLYPIESEELRKSFELQVIDLVNSVRYQRNLNGLDYSKKATISSIKHSDDMNQQNYFDHINKENETPFDRMKEEGIKYITAGENIAAGQTSAIYAHEAWMNSMGHRKNILGDYNNIGVGVSFGGNYKIYYTQNFYK